MLYGQYKSCPSYEESPNYVSSYDGLYTYKYLRGKDSAANLSLLGL